MHTRLSIFIFIHDEDYSQEAISAVRPNIGQIKTLNDRIEYMNK